MKAVLCLVAILGLIAIVEGDGYLLKPPARSTAWRMGFNTPKDYSDMSNDCGGIETQHDKNEGRCGVCGEEYLNPNKRLEPGPNNIYAAGTIVGNYKQGQTIDVTVVVTAFRKGYYEFRLCENNIPQTGIDSSIAVTNDCLNKNLLTSATTGKTRFTAIDGEATYKVKLPSDVSCTACVFQWRYRTGDSWGCKGGKCGLGIGPQEEYYGCSDIAIQTADEKLALVVLKQNGSTEIELPQKANDSLVDDMNNSTTATPPTTTGMLKTEKPSTTKKPLETTKSTRKPEIVKPSTTIRTTKMATSKPPLTTKKPTTRTTRKPVKITPKKPRQTRKPITRTTRKPVKITPKRKYRKVCGARGRYKWQYNTYCKQNCSHRPPHCPRQFCVCSYVQV